MKIARYLIILSVAGVAANAQGQSNTSPWPSSGNIGIGTTSPGDSRLKVQHSLSNPAHLESTNVEQLYWITTSDTDYIKALDIEKFWYNIPSGVTASGYQIGLASQVFVSDSNFLGTIDQQYGIWSRTGINVAGATGARTVNNAYGIYLEGLTGAGTVVNHYGLYQTGTGTKNYFGGNVGIGSSSPSEPLHVVGGPTMTAGWNRTAQLQATYPVLAFHSNAGSKWAGIGYDAGWGMRFWTGGSSNDVPGSSNLGVSISDAGRLGVGEPSPAARLDVYEPTTGVLTNTALKIGAYTSSVGGGPFLDFNLRWAGGYPDWIGGRIGSVYELNSPGANRTALVFYTNESNGGTSGVAGTTEKMRIRGDGNVGIGTTNPTQKLSVNGTIRAKEVIVEASPWPDDVFAADYDLPTVDEVAAHIEAEGHLPGVPSAAVVAEQGVAVGEMQRTLLRKVEELTLYVIRQEKRQDELQSEVGRLQEENATLREEVTALRDAFGDRDPQQP